jgi:starvation-inducible DNA-binding protein
MGMVQATINKQVANWSLLYTKFHNYHWNVTGSTFFDLHQKFEQLYNEANLFVDELAERLLAIGGKPVATLRDILANASLQEARGNESATEMIKQLVQDFGQLSGELRDSIKIAEEAGDAPTADLFTEMLTKVEKHHWMFNAYLEKVLYQPEKKATMNRVK